MGPMRGVLALAAILVVAGAACALDREGAPLADSNGFGTGGATVGTSTSQAVTSGSGTGVSSGGGAIGAGGAPISSGATAPTGAGGAEKGAGGAGGRVDPGPTCAEVYPGFATCSETEDWCEIIAPNGPVDCATTCAAYGGTCSGAYDNYPAGTCSIATNQQCDTTGFVDLVCKCSLG
jgi:hypothetical protein